jgi:hypothetical protein
MADLILAGADIITLDPRCPAASAVAISGGRIAAVGDRHDVRDWRGTRTEVIDLGGATLTPGLIDSHMHPVLGLSLTAGLDLSACADLGSVRAALKTAAAAAGRDQWIVGRLQAELLIQGQQVRVQHEQIPLHFPLRPHSADGNPVSNPSSLHLRHHPAAPPAPAPGQPWQNSRRNPGKGSSCALARPWLAPRQGASCLKRRQGAAVQGRENS